MSIEFKNNLPEIQEEVTFLDTITCDISMEVEEKRIEYKKFEEIFSDYKYSDCLTYDSIKDTELYYQLLGKPGTRGCSKKSIINSEKSNQIFRLYLIQFTRHLFNDYHSFNNLIEFGLDTKSIKTINPLYENNNYKVCFDNWKKIDCPKIAVGRTASWFRDIKITPNTFDRTLKKFINAGILKESESNKGWNYKNLGANGFGKLYWLNPLGLFQSFLIRDNIIDEMKFEEIRVETPDFNKNVKFINFKQITNPKYHDCFSYRKYRNTPVFSVNTDEDEKLILNIINEKTNGIIYTNLEFAKEANELRKKICDIQQFSNDYNFLYKTDVPVHFEWKDIQKNYEKTTLNKISDITGIEDNNIKIKQLIGTSMRYSSPAHNFTRGDYDMIMHKKFNYPEELDFRSSTYMISHYINEYKKTGKIDYDKKWSAYDLFMDSIKNNSFLTRDYYEDYDELREKIKAIFQWFAYKSTNNKFELENIQETSPEKLFTSWKSYLRTKVIEYNKKEETKLSKDKTYMMKILSFPKFDKCEDGYLFLFKELHNFFADNIKKRYSTFVFALEDYIGFQIELGFLRRGILVFRKYDAITYSKQIIKQDDFERDLKKYFEEAIKNLCKYYPNIFDFFPDFVEI